MSYYTSIRPPPKRRPKKHRNIATVTITIVTTNILLHYTYDYIIIIIINVNIDIIIISSSIIYVISYWPPPKRLPNMFTIAIIYEYTILYHIIS